MARTIHVQQGQLESALLSNKTLSEIKGYTKLCQELLDSHYDQPEVFEPIDIPTFLRHIIDLVEAQVV